MTLERHQNDIGTTSEQHWNDIRTTWERHWNDIGTISKQHRNNIKAFLPKLSNIVWISYRLNSSFARKYARKENDARDCKTHQKSRAALSKPAKSKSVTDDIDGEGSRKEGVDIQKWIEIASSDGLSLSSPINFKFKLVLSILLSPKLTDDG